MQQTNEILNELLEISKLIAETKQAEAAYEVPSGYFDSFPAALMNRIRSGNSFTQPETESLSPALTNARNNVFSVPENYFDLFPGQMMARLKAIQSNDAAEELSILSPLLGKAAKTNPFSTPEGYFQELSDNMAEGMKAVEFFRDELSHSSPLTGNLRNESTYTVPQDYFDQLAENILSKIKTSDQEAKIVPFRKKRIALRLAVAATITGIVVTVGFLTFNNHHTAAPATTADDPSTGLSKISDQEISNYLDNQDIPLAELPPVSNTPATVDFTDTDIRDLLADVSDNELLQYESDHGGSKD